MLSRFIVPLRIRRKPIPAVHDEKRFVHVLATRIGIGVYDQAWFDFRLQLFESITLPSMKAQTCQDFSWLLVVDREMPDRARARLERAVGDFSSVTILPVEFKTDLKETVVKWSQRQAWRQDAQFIMTSRLDDDDAMRVDAFERLHNEVEEFFRVSPHKYAVFSFNLGCMWLPSRRLGYTRYHDSHSLSLSFVEPAEECRGIYSKPHKDIKRIVAPRGAYIRGIDGDTIWWLYAAHNLASSDTGDNQRAAKILAHRYGYRVEDSTLREFGLEPDVIDQLSELRDPRVRKPVLRMWGGAMELEHEIRAVRTELATASGPQRSELEVKLRQLEQRRRAAGSDFVET